MGDFTCTLTHEQYNGWKAIRLANGIVDLFILPDLGGRIIQLRLGAQEFFYVNPRHRGRLYPPQENCSGAGWKNYGGSKVWPAPQGWENKEQWPGPPDAILDAGPYTWRVLEASPHCSAIYLESLADGYTGLTFSREIRLFENVSAVHILHKIRNSSSRPVRWAVWQVTQQAAASPLVVCTPARRYRQLFGDKTFEMVEVDTENGLWKLEYANQVAKFAVDAEEGWLAVLKPREQVALVETFPLFPGAAYPDDVAVEFWVNGRGTFTIPPGRIEMSDDPNGCDPFIETEILSPLAELDPGQDYSFPVTWRLAALPLPIVAKINSCALISEPVAVKLVDQGLHVTGAYGLFQAGSMELVSLDRSGHLLDTRPLGSFTPLQPCRVDQRIRTQDRLGKVRLRMRDSAGVLIDTIDESSLVSG
ncbi:MAG: DUF4380 domain-containing protein [Acidobacteriota bacterium]|nr:DUF4380 domain-containing protein [Acidobacteriota bacterium]